MIYETVVTQDGTALATRRYEAARASYARATFPVHALSIADDELMTLRGVHSPVNLHENAPRRVQSIAPTDLRVRRIGHFGSLRAEHQALLWPRMAQLFAGLSRSAAV